MNRFPALSLPASGLLLTSVAVLLSACAVDQPRQAAVVAALAGGAAAPEEAGAPDGTVAQDGAVAPGGAASGTGGAPTVEVSEVESADIEEFDTGLVCESRPRPGSRMHETVCYTREEYAASAEARKEEIKEVVRQLDEEQRNMDMMRRQQEEERRRSMVRASGL